MKDNIKNLTTTTLPTMEDIKMNAVRGDDMENIKTDEHGNRILSNMEKMEFLSYGLATDAIPRYATIQADDESLGIHQEPSPYCYINDHHPRYESMQLDERKLVREDIVDKLCVLHNNHWENIHYLGDKLEDIEKEDGDLTLREREIVQSAFSRLNHRTALHKEFREENKYDTHIFRHANGFDGDLHIYDMPREVRDKINASLIDDSGFVPVPKTYYLISSDTVKGTPAEKYFPEGTRLEFYAFYDFNPDSIEEGVPKTPEECGYEDYFYVVDYYREGSFVDTFTLGSYGFIKYNPTVMDGRYVVFGGDDQTFVLDLGISKDEIAKRVGGTFTAEEANTLYPFDYILCSDGVKDYKVCECGIIPRNDICDGHAFDVIGVGCGNIIEAIIPHENAADEEIYSFEYVAFCHTFVATETGLALYDSVAFSDLEEDFVYPFGAVCSNSYMRDFGEYKEIGERARSVRSDGEEFEVSGNSRSFVYDGYDEAETRRELKE